jgi:hypothetical protein
MTYMAASTRAHRIRASIPVCDPLHFFRQFARNASRSSKLPLPMEFWHDTDREVRFLRQEGVDVAYG